MSNVSGKHKISDIVKITGIPRTTINDWINRYSQYLSFEMQGKRKLYTDHAIEVINEINSLREAGQSSFEIDDALAKNHPVKPEIAEEPTPGITHKVADDGTVHAHESQGEEFAVIARKQTDEIARLISDQLKNLTVRLDDLETENRQLSKSSNKWLGITVLIVILMFAAGGFLLWKYSKQVESNIRLSADRTKALDLIDAKDKDLNSQKMHIDTLSQTLKLTRQQHESGMKELKKDFDEEKVKLKQELQVQADAKVELYKRELEILKEKAAQEKLALLKQLTDIKISNKEKTEIIGKLQENSQKMSEALESLSDKYRSISSENTPEKSEKTENNSEDNKDKSEEPSLEGQG